MTDALGSFGAEYPPPNGSANGGDDDVVMLTDILAGTEYGPLLRRCAIPHDFNHALLQLLGNLSEEDADDLYTEFAELSIMQLEPSSLSMHDQWRSQMWRWWLNPVRHSEFVGVNEQLVRFFEVPVSGTGEDPAARRRMFHMLGCRQDEGFQLFEQQFRAARWKLRFSECELLLQLVHEYDPVLSPLQLAELSYDGGKLASDLRQWQRAVGLFRAVLEYADIGERLRINAMARLGNALHNLGKSEEAEHILEDADTRTFREPTLVEARCRVLHELATIYSDTKRPDQARKLLTEALKLASDDDGDVDIPGIYHTLGHAQLRLADFPAAINSFTASIDALRRRGDAIRVGVVLTGLGEAQLRNCDWPAAQATLLESLDNRRAAGDLPGQANTLLLLTKSLAAQNKMIHAASAAAEAAALYRSSDNRDKMVSAQLAQARYLRRSNQRANSNALLQSVIDEARAVGNVRTELEARLEMKRNRPEFRYWWLWCLLLIVGVCAGWFLLVSQI